MSWLVKALSTSVGQKFVMGITGLLLCGFLVAHLAGNFLLFVGPEAYNHYAHSLHEQEWLLKIAEGGLIALFVLHLALAVVTSRSNRKARAVDYDVSESKQGVFVVPNGGASSWMFVTGAVVLGFLILHLIDFTLEARPDLAYTSTAGGNTTELEPYDKARMILTSPPSIGVYIIGCLFLGVHLTHGFSSAFQSLGLSHPNYDGPVKLLGMIFGWVIALGFASFVFWALATNV